MKLLMGLLSVFFVQSAFAISADKCTNTDWFAVGRDAGAKGQTSDTILKTQKECQKKGVEISLEQYQKGWQMGIGQYCSQDNAYKMGFNKKSPTKFCPTEMKPDFDQFYTWGKEASKLEKEIKSKESKLKGKIKQLSSVSKKKESLEKDVKKLEEDTKELNQKVNAIESQMKAKRSILRK